MIIAEKNIVRHIKAGRALLVSAKECEDEEIGLTLQSFLNLMDTLDDYVKLQSELTTARETNRKLHRRCQLAESAVQENIAACKKQGQSLGRGLSASGYLMLEAELAKLKEYHKGGCIDCDHYAKVMSLKAQLATEQEKVKRLREAAENKDKQFTLDRTCISSHCDNIIDTNYCTKCQDDWAS